MTAAEITGMIRYLATILPDWLTITNNIEGQFVKITKKRPISQVLEEINRQIYQHQQQ